ncbi:MAG: SGNH/GDSL hydrolase family protein [Acidobacteriota bacterium]
MGLLLILALLYIAVHILVFLPAIRRAFPRFCQGAGPFLLVCDSMLAGVLLLELYFAAIHDQSDGFNLTRSGRQWFERHWKPVNSLGYRDAEPALPSPGQRTVMILGDSFAAGHGIERAENRFSDVAARALGPGWRVYNVSQPGWDTVDEAKAMHAFPVKPDVIVLCYYLNDIFHAAKDAGYPLAFSVNLPTGFMKELVDVSALADYVYWRLARGGNLSGGAGTFWDTLKGAYADPAVWAIHARALEDIAAYCRENRITLVAVVFPMLQAPSESAPITGKVAGALAAMGADVIDLTPAMTGRPARELVVNALDAHPNEAVHRQVGELLAGRMHTLEASLGTH